MMASYVPEKMIDPRCIVQEKDHGADIRVIASLTPPMAALGKTEDEIREKVLDIVSRFPLIPDLSSTQVAACTDHLPPGYETARSQVDDNSQDLLVHRWGDEDWPGKALEIIKPVRLRGRTMDRFVPSHYLYDPINEKWILLRRLSKTVSSSGIFCLSYTEADEASSEARAALRKLQGFWQANLKIGALKGAPTISGGDLRVR